MTKRRDIVAGWLADDLPVDLDALPGHREFMASLEEMTRETKREAAEMAAFLRAQDDPWFYLPGPDAFDLALEDTDELLAAWKVRIK
jgi:hypothetical protein